MRSVNHIITILFLFTTCCYGSDVVVSGSENSTEDIPGTIEPTKIGDVSVPQEQDAQIKESPAKDSGCLWGQGSCTSSAQAPTIVDTSTSHSPGTVFLSKGKPQKQQLFAKDMKFTPPESFELSAHIKNNPDDGNSFFVNSSILPRIPYGECGAQGSITTKKDVKDFQLRHFVGETPWERVSSPMILICLHPLEVTVSSSGTSANEVSRVFEAGEVLFFEDTLGKGHKLRGVQQAVDLEHRTLSVLTIYLPNLRGLDVMSSYFDTPTNPCPNNPNESTDDNDLSQQEFAPVTLTERRLNLPFLKKTYQLEVFGLKVQESVSTFLLKVLGFGGFWSLLRPIVYEAPAIMTIVWARLCITALTTKGFVFLAEKGLDELDRFLGERRIQKNIQHHRVEIGQSNEDDDIINMIVSDNSNITDSLVSEEESSLEVEPDYNGSTKENVVSGLTSSVLS